MLDAVAGVMLIGTVCLPGSIGPQIQLTPDGGIAGELFGTSAAIEGDVAVVGSINANGGTGVVRVFERNGGGWEEVAVLTASDGEASDYFGLRVDLYDDTIVVGAPYADIGALIDRGAVYVFVRPEGGWVDATETAKLRITSSGVNDLFGRDVAIWGDTIVAGAPLRNLGFNPDQGAVYVFVRPEGGWMDATQTARLTVSDADAQDNLGQSVDIAGDTIVAGAANADNTAMDAEDGPGAAYVFIRPEGGWVNSTEAAKLTAGDGAAYDRFGFSVKLGDGVIAVGTPNDGNTGSTATDGSGAAYVFVRPEAGWVDAEHDAKLVYSSAESCAHFGYSLAWSGDRLIITAPNRMHTPPLVEDGAGAAYYYERPDGGWSGVIGETQELLADDSAPLRFFGYCAAMSEDWMMIGAPVEGAGGTEPGSTYFHAFDNDLDGVANHADSCPDDPAKLDGGVCGCGVPDTDSDGDGLADCIDECPDDAEKLAAGDCGCGAAETDGDGDGVADCIDNCPGSANADQADADGDGVGDACAGGVAGGAELDGDGLVPAAQADACCGGGMPMVLPLLLLGMSRRRHRRSAGRHRDRAGVVL